MMRIASQPFSDICSPVMPQQVSESVTIQGFFIPGTLRNRAHSFSLLRLLGLASLFVGVRSQLFPATLELSSLDGTNGFILNGDQAYDYSGFAVSSAGDVNGDGVADLVIGAPGKYDSGKPGKSYVVFGKLGLGAGGVINLSSLNGITGFVLNGNQADDFSGASVSRAGDVNGDGMADFLIGAPGKYDAGKPSKSYVVFGREGLGAGGVINLSSLDGTNGFAFNGEQAGDRSGISVSSAGDVNGDGVTDLFIGAWEADPTSRNQAGKSYVVFGKPENRG